MVSIAGQLYINGEYEAGFEYIIKPDGYEITKEASDIHGITQEIALEKGEDISFAMPWINGYINRADLIVFHNASFDVGIISGEQMRLEYPQTSLICHSNKIFCTKEKSTNICKIPNSRGGYKWPSLAELCAFCGVENQTAHNALSDVIATKECYFYMVEQGYF
jgi:DNA polymerase III epsilon subunit-like protein